MQKEMTAEQDHFNMLSQQIGELTEGSPEYEELSEEIVASQSRLAMLMGRNMKCFTQQTTLQSQELMERYDDDSIPNGDLSSSDDDYDNVRTNLHPTPYPHKPNLVNGHKTSTYHNGFRDEPSQSEPPVKKGIRSRDFFEDSDSFPELVVHGEGEPDICDEPDFCDSDNEDQTQGSYDVNPSSSIGGNTRAFSAIIEEQEIQPQSSSQNETVPTSNKNSIAINNNNANRNSSNLSEENSLENHSQTVSIPIEKNYSKAKGLSSEISCDSKVSPTSNGDSVIVHSSNTSKDNPDSIVHSAQVQKSSQVQNSSSVQNGANKDLKTLKQSVSSERNEIAAQGSADMDKNKASDELMISISNKGKISLVPTDEQPKRPQHVQKGTYKGPNQAQAQTQSNDFANQKQRFEALRKKFSSESSSFEKSDSEAMQEHGDDDPDRPSTNEQLQRDEDTARLAAEKKRSEISMVLSIKTTSIHDNQTTKHKSPERVDDMDAKDAPLLAASNKQTKPKASNLDRQLQSEGAGIEILSQAEWDNKQTVHNKPVSGLANKKPEGHGRSHLSNEISAQEKHVVQLEAPQISAPRTANEASVAAGEANLQEAPTRRVLTTLDVKPAPIIQKEVDSNDGRTSPFEIIEDDKVAELVVGKPSPKPQAMGNKPSQPKEALRKKEEEEIIDVKIQDLQTSETPSEHGEKESKVISTIPPVLVPAEGFTGDEKVKERVTLKDWDPTAVFEELYKVKLEDDKIIENELEYINMEGYMEKLPINKKKATLLKTWKRRYFKAEDGILYYYECQNPADDLLDDADSIEEDSTQHKDKVNGSIQLNGGTLEELGGRLLGIDDGRGNYLVVRCPTDKEYNDWKRSLETQIIDIVKMNHVRPVLRSTPNRKKKKVPTATLR